MVGIFEIKPATSNIASANNFTTIRLTYKKPGDTVSHKFTYNAPYDYKPFNEIEKHYQFSAAVAMFGSLLRSSSYIRNGGWTELQTLAIASADTNDMLQQEFITLVTQAKDLYTKKKKKKKSKDDEE